MADSSIRRRQALSGLGKTLYAQPPLELSERVERTRTLTNQTTTQIVIDALDLWTILAPEAHIALRRVRQAEGQQAIEDLAEQFGRTIIERSTRS